VQIFDFIFFFSTTKWARYKTFFFFGLVSFLFVFDDLLDGWGFRRGRAMAWNSLKNVLPGHTGIVYTLEKGVAAAQASRRGISLQFSFSLILFFSQEITIHKDK
jgi:hypothetical protein